MTSSIYSNEELLNHLRDLAEGDQPPEYREVSAAEGPSASTYEDRFGSFNEAVREAGLKPASRRNENRYTDEDLLNHLRDLAGEDQSVTRSELRATEGPSAGTYGYRFGSFSEAVHEAGLETTRRSPNKYSEEELLNHLRDLAEGDQAPTTAEVRTAEGPSADTYRRRFGSFSEAVRAAGLKVSPDRRQQKYAEEELLNHLRDLAEGDQAPTTAEVRTAEGPSVRTYRYRFGSFSEAVRAAGLEVPPGRRRRYTDEELLSWIQVFVAEFDTVPTTTDLKSWPGPSIQTYRNRFGTWGTAIYRAGLECSPTTDEEADQ